MVAGTWGELMVVIEVRAMGGARGWTARAAGGRHVGWSGGLVDDRQH